MAEIEIVGSYCEDGVTALIQEYRQSVTREGFHRGVADMNGDPLMPNPYPPYVTGTQEATWWLDGYRMGRYGYAVRDLVGEGIARS